MTHEPKKDRMIEILGKVKHADFISSRKRDRVKTFLPIAHHTPMIIYARLQMALMRVKDPDRAIAFFQESSRALSESRIHERNPVMREVYDHLVELNEIGIDQVQTIKEARQLVEECRYLKRVSMSTQSEEAANQFLETANNLYRVREHLIATNKMKNEMQREIVETLQRVNILSAKDMAQLGVAGAIDSVAGGHLATAAKLGHITGKYAAKQMEKSMMSSKILDRSIRLTELLQARFRAWKESVGRPDRLLKG